MQRPIRTVVIATGGFDPCHSGHIAYLEAARALGDHLVVGLNSDGWLIRKKGVFFMDWQERATVLRALRAVDEVISFDDSDGSARDAIAQVRNHFNSQEIIFANGGDRTANNIAEMDQSGIRFLFGVGGDHKQNSSSDLLRNYETHVVSKLEQESSPFRSFR